MSFVAPGSESSASEVGPGGGRRAWKTASSRVGTGLAIRTDQSANRCVLHLRGRLCWDTVPLLDRHVDRLGCRWCDEVVVDLGSVGLMDAVGARLLVGLGHYVRGRGGQFRTEGANAEITALIRVAKAELDA